jgi:hypothetical protein
MHHDDDLQCGIIIKQMIVMIIMMMIIITQSMMMIIESVSMMVISFRARRSWIRDDRVTDGSRHDMYDARNSQAVVFNMVEGSQLLRESSKAWAGGECLELATSSPGSFWQPQVTKSDRFRRGKFRGHDGSERDRPC